MDATSKAAMLAAKYVGAHNIVQVEVRGATDPHIRVTFERRLSPEVRKEVTLAAEPFIVRFVDRPFGKIVEK